MTLGGEDDKLREFFEVGMHLSMILENERTLLTQKDVFGYCILKVTFLIGWNSSDGFDS